MISNVNFFSSSNASNAGSAKPNKEDMMAKLTALGIPSNVVQQGPEAVRSYAEQNGITLPPPPQKPDESNGAPTFDRGNKQQQVTDGEPPAEFKQKLIALGVPEDTISQGRDAVMQYAEQNGITLPSPPSGNGNRLSVSA